MLSTGDNTVSFLETATGKRLGRLAVPRVDWRGGRTIAFSPDGAVFAYQVGGGAVHLFDARTRRPLRVLHVVESLGIDPHVFGVDVKQTIFEFTHGFEITHPLPNHVRRIIIEAQIGRADLGK